jgi:hypothetical protein
MNISNIVKSAKTIIDEKMKGTVNELEMFKLIKKYGIFTAEGNKNGYFKKVDKNEKNIIVVDVPKNFSAEEERGNTAWITTNEKEFKTSKKFVDDFHIAHYEKPSPDLMALFI